MLRNANREEVQLAGGEEPLVGRNRRPSVKERRDRGDREQGGPHIFW
jgi:hypothetical protein